MNKLKYILLVSLIAGFISCKDSIDDIPLSYNEVSIIGTDSLYVEYFVNNIYVSLPTGFDRLGSNSFMASATDEAVHSVNYSEANEIAKGMWGPTYNPDDAWQSNYAGIRKANDFLNNVLPTIQPKTFKSKNVLNVLIGQVYFLRAMFHFELVKRYGGIPIVTEVLAADASSDIARNTYDECVQFITAQCDSAAKYLPVSYVSTDLGRATKGAAYALKARMLLYAASPLFNDPSQSDDTYTHGAYDAKKWETAASAAHDAIGLGVYSLNADYIKLFITLAGNNEYILSRMVAKNNNLERLSGPTGYTYGGGGTGPSLNLVDDFEMADGTKFSWSNSTMAANPFLNRDPRFYKSILSNGQSWMGDVVDTYEGGNDKISTISTKTSFYLRKFLDESAKWFGGVTSTTFHDFPIFRYAEVLLNYAEAMNEAYGPEADPKAYGLTAKKAIEMIRARAGLSPSVLASGLSKDQLREVIRHERRIELAFEEHRHLDVRRWKIAKETLGAPVKGLKITKNTDSTFSYETIVVDNRVFEDKMYLYPIPQSELNRNTLMVQNPGW